MVFTSIKTGLIKEGDDLLEVISKNIPRLPEESILALTIKVVSVCQGSIVEKKTNSKLDKARLIKEEADYYIDSKESKYKIILTIKNNILTINSAINECNANGKYILWPKDTQNVTNNIWRFLRERYLVKKVGVIITDSRFLPMNRGAVGTSICHCGFKGIYNYGKRKDIFGRELSMTQINIAEALATSAVLSMGEADEMTPICVIEKVDKIEFQDRIPTQKELNNFRINMESDIYAPILNKANWKKGRSNNSVLFE